MNYPRLFEKGRIGGLELKNRIVMSPMDTNLGHYKGDATYEIIKYYEERAKGGTGLIITEFTRINEVTGIGSLHQLSAASRRNMRNLQWLTETVHRYGTKIFLQLFHMGREVSSKILAEPTETVQPSAAAGKSPASDLLARELTTAECEALVQDFINAAVVAQNAGFDGVEIHAAHGYLISQFLSPLNNMRTDKYGGSLEKRQTFLIEVVEGIRKACGPNFPMSVRINGDDFMQEKSVTLQDSIYTAKLLESKGVNAINVSAGRAETIVLLIGSNYMPEGYNKHLATEIKKNVSIPVIAVNNVKSPETAEQFLEEGVSDFIALGRASLADPEWANKARSGQEKHIRKCIGCLRCFRRIGEGYGLQCTINPNLGRELTFNEDTLKKNGDGRAVAVIGGGPAGMQAAYILGKRGFRPVLFEKTDSLGGTMRLAAKPACKGLVGDFIETLKADMASVGVEIRLNTAATVAEVEKLSPYGVIVAAGGSPIIPRSIPGIGSDHVITAVSYMTGGIDVEGKKVVVIGGGITGLETAEVLAGKNNKVTVVEMLNEVAPTMYGINKYGLMSLLKKQEVDILPGHSLAAVEKSSVLIRTVETGEEKRLDADIVVLAMGVVSNKAVAEEFEAAFDKVITVGDTSAPGEIVDAILEGNGRAYVF